MKIIIYSNPLCVLLFHDRRRSIRLPPAARSGRGEGGRRRRRRRRRRRGKSSSE
jgi:hypothetical protein